MLHGQGVMNFFESFHTYCDQHQIPTKTGRKWSEHLLFATDYPYFGEAHAKEILQTILNQNFFDRGGTLEDVGNILGLNQIHLLPEYHVPLVSKSSAPGISGIFQNTRLLPPQFPKRPREPLDAESLMYESLAGLIEQGKLEILKLLFQYPDPSFHNNHEFCLITAPKNNPDRQIPLIYQRLAGASGESLGMWMTLPPNTPWKTTGVKFFEATDRPTLQDVFAHHYPIAVAEDAISFFGSLYQ